MSEQKTVIRFRAQAKDKLGYWLGNKLDEIAFLVAAGIAFTYKLDGTSRPGSSQLSQLAFASSVTAPSSNRKVFPGTITATSSLTTSDKMSWNLLIKAKAAAVRRRLKPIRMNGADSYVIVMSPEQARDLKSDSDYRTIVTGAGTRGDANPLFTGAFAKVDGLILYEHARVPTTLGAASGSKYGASGTVDGAAALFLGAQALGFARIGDAHWDESDNQDYGNREGIGYGRMIGFVKPVFTSLYDSSTDQDFAMQVLYTAAA